MTYNKKEREYYNLQRQTTCESLGITKSQYNWFRRNGEKLHRIYENECNGLYESEEAYNLARSWVEEETDTKCQQLGLYVYYQTDPRGATIYLDAKPIPRNNYTTAHCIY